MAVNLSDSAKDYISRHKTFLKKNDLKEFYSQMPEGLRCEISEFLIAMSPNFQKYLEVIPQSFLANSKDVKGFTVGSNIVKIGKGAFKNSAIESIDLNEVEIISDSAFEGCSKLKEVYLPKTVKMIGRKAWPENIILKSGPRKRNSLRFPKNELEWYKEHLILVKSESNEEE